jgi:hypothetical protein
MLDVLRRAPVLQLGGGQSVTLRNIRPPAKSLALSAEATIEGEFVDPTVPRRPRFRVVSHKIGATVCGCGKLSSG